MDENDVTTTRWQHKRKTAVVKSSKSLWHKLKYIIYYCFHSRFDHDISVLKDLHIILACSHLYFNKAVPEHGKDYAMHIPWMYSTASAIGIVQAIALFRSC